MSTPGGVLGGAAGDELSVIVVQEVLEDGLVFILGEDGIVGLEAVLLEKGFIAKGLDVWARGKKLSSQFCGRDKRGREDKGRWLGLTKEGVLQAEQRVVSGRHIG